MLNLQQLHLNYTSWCCCTAIVMVESTIQWMLCTLCGLITYNMPLIDSTRCQQSTWRYQGMFKDKSKYPTLTRMSFCQCRLKLVFTSIFRQFGWKHVALLLDRSDLFSLTVGKSHWRIVGHHSSPSSICVSKHSHYHNYAFACDTHWQAKIWNTV